MLLSDVCYSSFESFWHADEVFHFRLPVRVSLETRDIFKGCAIRENFLVNFLTRKIFLVTKNVFLVNFVTKNIFLDVDSPRKALS